MFQLTYTYSEIYVHVHMLYRHVFTMFSHFHACSSLSVQVTYLTYTSTDIQLSTMDVHIDDMLMFAFCFSQLAGVGTGCCRDWLCSDWLAGCDYYSSTLV